MAKFGFLPRFRAILWKFHDGMQAHVENGGEFSKKFRLQMGLNRAVGWPQHCSE